MVENAIEVLSLEAQRSASGMAPKRKSQKRRQPKPHGLWIAPGLERTIKGEGGRRGLNEQPYGYYLQLADLVLGTPESQPPQRSVPVPAPSAPETFSSRPPKAPKLTLAKPPKMPSPPKPARLALPKPPLRPASPKPPKLAIPKPPKHSHKFR